MPNIPSHEPFLRAERVLAQFGICAAPVPVERIAKLQGVRLRFSPFDKDLSGLVYIKEGVPIIGVNSLQHPNRQRFTIAHELGHLELHRQMITANVHVDKDFPALMRDSQSASGTEPIEIEANTFAAELLMPRKLIKEALAGKQFDIEDERPLEELARKFRVSRHALEYRIRNL